MSSAVIRSLSPALGSLSNVVLTAAADAILPRDKADVARVARHHTLMGANSVVNLIELIPSDYSQVLADPLHALVQLCHKLHNARTTLAAWRAHQSAGTMPAHLRGSAPKVQHTSEFAGSELACTCKTSLEAAYVDFQ